MANKKEIVRRELQLPTGYEEKLAFVLENVLTPEECNAYIEETEKRGFEIATIYSGFGSVVAPEVRNNGRCLWFSEEESGKIWARIKDFVPLEFKKRKALCLNDRLSFIRYDPGEYFKPHYDGQFSRGDGERSLITMQLYLNEGFEGGSTTFFSPDMTEQVEVIPKTGSALIFQHDILHEGSELIKGRKYALGFYFRFRLSFIRYDPGEYFKPHYDGQFSRGDGERSLITMQLYLNEGFEGGSTTFFSPDMTEQVEVIPKTGSALIFQHDILHEGSELIKGRKYAVRTDVMFSTD